VGVVINVLASKAVDCGFVGGVMVSDHFRYKNANHYATDEFTIYRFPDENANPSPMNPRYAAFETSTLTHPDEPTSYSFRIVGSSVA
jgi:hypothetical protein